MIINWNDIDTVLLDMDGTLLDRHFDDHFWLEHLPRRWAECNGTTTDNAVKHLHALFDSQEGTLNWTDLDYWSEQLGMDIPLLKQEVDHLIAVHPHVIEFLLFLKQHGKAVWLVTAAHSKTLDLKLNKTNIGDYFDGIVSAHQVGLPKEDTRFWKELQNLIVFDPVSTMLGEDSEASLDAARRFGIRHLVHVGRHSSRSGPKKSERYKSIDYFSRLIPPNGEMQIAIPDVL